MKIYILLVLLFFSINQLNAQTAQIHKSKIPISTTSLKKASPLNLNLTVLIEGLFDGSIMIPDTVTVELRSVTSTSIIIDSQKGILNSAGQGTFSFTNALIDSSYFIVVRHRNAIETWSITAQNFTSSELNYDFTTSKSKAYGNNLKLKNGKYCLFSGDVNQDGRVNLLDLIAVDNGNAQVIKGYSNLDINGDNNVNLLDLIIVDNNNSIIAKKVAPLGTGDQSYHIVLIGSIYWLKENLNVGTMIFAGESFQTDNGIIEKYCQDNNPANCDKYGGLYQWNEAVQYDTTTEGTMGICPQGFHIPTWNELSALKTAVGGDVGGNSLKEIGQGTNEGAGTNESGFSALLSGYKHPDYGFFELFISTDFWSSSVFGTSDARYMYLLSSDDTINLDHIDKHYGYSVRCVMD